MPSQLYKNNATATYYSTVPGALPIGGTTVVLSSSHGNRFPNPTNGDFFYATLYEKDGSGGEINYEIVKVTAVSGDTLTVERDIEGVVGVTGGRAYPSAAGVNPSGIVYVELRYTAYSANNAFTKDAYFSNAFMLMGA